MITAVKIQGFQSHLDSEFSLGAGLNVITGPSDGGKTAIIRAIRWVAFNDPQGDSFLYTKRDPVTDEIVEQAEEAVVTIYLSNGAVITKRRRKGKTSYLIQQTPSDEGSLYEKSEVPDDLKRLLQIEKQTFGDFETALNFSFQLDPPFLISETASAGAKILGKLAGTESVDLAIKGVRQDTHYTRLERTNAEKDIERIAGSMLAYAHIDDAKEAVDLAEMLLEQIDANHTKFESLKDFRTKHEAYSDALGRLAAKLERLAIVPDLEADLKNIEKAQARYDALLDLYNTYFGIGNKLTEINRHLQDYKEVGQASEVVKALDGDLERLTLMNTLTKAYQKHTDDYSKTVAVLEKTQDLPKITVTLGDVENGLLHLADLKYLAVDYVNAVRRTETALERVKDFYGLTEAYTVLSGTAAEYDRLVQLKNLHDMYSKADSLLYQNEKTLEQRERDLQDAQNEEAAAWEAAGGICPLCGNGIEGDTCQ